MKYVKPRKITLNALINKLVKIQAKNKNLEVLVDLDSDGGHFTLEKVKVAKYDGKKVLNLQSSNEM